MTTQYPTRASYLVDEGSLRWEREGSHILRLAPSDATTPSEQSTGTLITRVPVDLGIFRSAYMMFLYVGAGALVTGFNATVYVQPCTLDATGIGDSFYTSFNAADATTPNMYVRPLVVSQNVPIIPPSLMIRSAFGAGNTVNQNKFLDDLRAKRLLIMIKGET